MRFNHDFKCSLKLLKKSKNKHILNLPATVLGLEVETSQSLKSETICMATIQGFPFLVAYASKTLHHSFLFVCFKIKK